MSAFFKPNHHQPGPRLGVLTTTHGRVETPAFMPVATRAAFKGLTPQTVALSGAAMILVNSYHLLLRPGIELVENAGGIHQFMHWPGPILSDSGGYQVYSLASLCQIDNDGVRFRSHIDGQSYRLTPQDAIDNQRRLGVDIAMVLDECPGWPAKPKQADLAHRRTLDWAQRSYDAWDKGGPMALFAITQGSMDKDLRRQSAQILAKIDFSGYAIGGLSVGESHATMIEIVAATTPYLPAAKPRYLMGVGRPADIVSAVEHGVDMFDCVFPTRAGRTGKAFVWGDEINILNARHRTDNASLDPQCSCPTCRNHSRAYLHHLFKCREMLGTILLSQHNVYFYQHLMRRIRRHLADQTFSTLAKEVQETFPTRDRC